jgi:hypothetical protein
MTAAIEERLRGLGIGLAETQAHFLLTRGECLMLVARSSPGPAGMGSTGILTPSGLAYLVWRDGSPFLAAHGVETPATPEQVEAIGRFSADVRSALTP